MKTGAAASWKLKRMVPPVVGLLLALGLLLGGALPADAAPGEISTLAGGGNDLGDGALATLVPLAATYVTMDAAGNLYLSETGAHRVRKVAAGTGIITTVAGNGTKDFYRWGYGDGGPATSAMLNEPSGLSVDSAGNLYIADAGNGRIRKVAADTGIITTVAGMVAPYYTNYGDGGPATSATLAYPISVAVDSAGNIYLADAMYNAVRKVAARTGIITTVAGFKGGDYSGDGGPASAAALNSPTGVSVDAAGNLYIVDNGNHRIRKVEAGTLIIRTVVGNGKQGVMGAGDGGTALAASLNYPHSVATDSFGNIYFSDYGGELIRKVAVGTNIVSSISLGGYGVATDLGGNLYYPGENGRVRKVAAFTAEASIVAGSGLSTFTGDGGAASAAKLTVPTTVALDGEGNLYIADQGSGRVRKVTAGTGTITTVAGKGAASSAGDGSPATSVALSPAGVAIAPDGTIYIADRSQNRIRKVAADTGVITTVAGNGAPGFFGDGGPATAANLSSPAAVTLDAAGNLYIADTDNHCVRKVSAGTGVITTVAGYGDMAFGGDGGPATLASMNQPMGVAVDGAGNLYIADFGNHRIRKVAAGTGIISTFAGNGNAMFYGDGGAATSAGLFYPSGVAVDGSGNVYIADARNNRIRKVDIATGIIGTVAGKGTAGFSGDGGAATAAELKGPQGVAVDPAGNIFIVDSGNNRVRKVVETIAPQVTAIPPGGTYAPGQQVALAAGEPATVYYTTDGSDPATSGTRQGFDTSGQLTINVTTTLKYHAVDVNGNASAVQTQVYTVPTHTVTVVFDGTGGGSVNGDVGCGSGSACPPASFPHGTQLTVAAAPDQDSRFDGWSGACTGTGKGCQVTVDDDKTITASFAAVARVRIVGGGDFPTVSAAYGAAGSGAVIQLRAVEFAEGELAFGRQGSFSVMGGYDTEFTAARAASILEGKVLIRSGTVRMDGIAIR